MASTRTPKPARTRYSIRYSSSTRTWVVKRGADPILFCSTKAEAIANARTIANALLAHSHLAQIVVFGKDGKIQTEWTYGDDPVRTKG